MSSPVQFHPASVVDLVREQGPCTVTDIRIGLNFPTDRHAMAALQVTERLTKAISHIDAERGAYWTAVVSFEEPS